MKMSYYKYFLLLLIIFIEPELSYSQIPGRKVENEKMKIQDFFLKNLPWENMPDSTIIIGFSFKIKVEKSSNGKILPVSIIASDSIAYKLYPKYEFLKAINYKPFLKNKKEADFIIPVLIEMVGSRPPKQHEREKLIDFLNETSFAKTLYKSTLSMFHIIKEEEENYPENFIYLDPILIWMDRRTNN